MESPRLVVGIGVGSSDGGGGGDIENGSTTTGGGGTGGGGMIMLSSSRKSYNNNNNNNENDDIISLASGSQLDGGDNGNGNTTTTTNPNDTSIPKHLQIAKKESQAVFKLRILVFLALFVASLIVSVIVYIITSTNQQDEYKIQYYGMSQQLVVAFEEIATEKISVLGNLRVAVMAHADDNRRNETNNNTSSSLSWPFVTLSSFQQRAATVRKLSHSLYIGIYPVVQPEQRTAWEIYSAQQKNIWMGQSLKYQERANYTVFGASEIDLSTTVDSLPILEPIFGQIDTSPGPWMPIWQTSPVVNSIINFNFYNQSFMPETTLCYQTGKAIFGGFLTGPPGDMNHTDKVTRYYAGYLSTAAQEVRTYDGDPFSNIVLPIYGSYEKNDTQTVAVLTALVQWAAYFRNVLPEQATGITLVLSNPCNGPWTYTVDGSNVTFVGQGDYHDTKFNKYVQSATFINLTSFQDGTEYGVELQTDYCPITLDVYPSQVFYDQYITNLPIIMTVTVAIVFLFTVLMFLLYDRLVERRQKLVLTKAIQSGAVVASLFPQSVADRVLTSTAVVGGGGVTGTFNNNNQLSSKNKLKNLLSSNGQYGDHSTNDDTTSEQELQPIAELFPFTTVLFADIAGFTAWSSTREPTQVFTLLQGVYQAFDAIAKRRRVFKVETIGDSYVAVTGLPEPQEHHAIIMSRFAVECQQKMFDVTTKLEVRLGPGTSDLCMRMGLHSGPVTGGVLMGEKARFQLFGDTVNTAARMESTGIKNRIQVSSNTATLLIEAGKKHWVVPREDQVHAKGKGVLQTYWLNVHSNTSTVRSSSSHGEETKSTDFDMLDAIDQPRSSSLRQVSTSMNQSTMSAFSYNGNAKNDNLVSWICQLLQIQLKKVVANRKPGGRSSKKGSVDSKLLPTTAPIDEVVESITVPEFKERNAKEQLSMQDSSHVVLDLVVETQLHQLVSTIALSYNDNPFHNFEHACHVTMSANKLLMRVVTPDLDLDKMESAHVASHLHDYTHGIHSDPITQLAILFSAVIHDVDHRGVSNIQLMEECTEMAAMYKNKSVAEQNSLDIAWALLMSDSFTELRNCMFETMDELRRFRQIVVNAVMATDIMDKELNDLRRQRWEKAFAQNNKELLSKSSRNDNRNLQATIVIEHLMQASDVAHTMQHWHVYQRWNRNLFREIYYAYRNGRVKANPYDFWYTGELSFFDNYIIPLAKKLKDCNVFGVSSDEYLNYAEKNRAEWEARGRDLVTEIMDEINSENESHLADI